MKKSMAGIILFLAAAAGYAQGTDPLAFAKSIRWYGQDDLRIELAGAVIRVDPVFSPTGEKADIVLVTHPHSDHWAPAAVAKLAGPDTAVLTGFASDGHRRIKPGEEVEVKGIRIKAVPAYNLGSMNHPKAEDWCGFLISGGGLTVYVTGDTNRIPEMKSISCDIVLLPLGQIYTMSSVAEAEQAALDVKAKVAIPVHYGMYEGSDADADAFVSGLKAKSLSALRLPKAK